MSDLPEMPCQEFVERVTEYLEGTLSADDHLRLETHLAECPHCAAYLAQMRLVLTLTGELRTEDVAPAMHSELLRVFARWRGEGG